MRIIEVFKPSRCEGVDCIAIIFVCLPSISVKLVGTPCIQISMRCWTSRCWSTKRENFSRALLLGRGRSTNRKHTAFRCFGIVSPQSQAPVCGRVFVIFWHQSSVPSSSGLGALLCGVSKVVVAGRRDDGDGRRGGVWMAAAAAVADVRLPQEEPRRGANCSTPAATLCREKHDPRPHFGTRSRVVRGRSTFRRPRTRASTRMAARRSSRSVAATANAVPCGR